MLEKITKQLTSLQRNMYNYGRYIEELEKDVAILKRDSHRPIEGLEERLRKLENKQGD